MGVTEEVIVEEARVTVSLCLLDENGSVWGMKAWKPLPKTAETSIALAP